MPYLLTPLVKAIALTSSGVFAGFTLALSLATVPAILKNPSAHSLLSQWRQQYLIGFYVSRPLCAVNFLSFADLAFFCPSPSSPSSSSVSRTLYLIAALLNASGVPYALTFLRRTNGALSLRAEKVCGREPRDPGARAINYANQDRGSVEREAGDGKEGGKKGWGPRELVERWKWHNDIRTWVLVLGTLVGGVAVGLDGR